MIQSVSNNCTLYTRTMEQTQPCVTLSLERSSESHRSLLCSTVLPCKSGTDSKSKSLLFWRISDSLSHRLQEMEGLVSVYSITLYGCITCCIIYIRKTQKGEGPACIFCYPLVGGIVCGLIQLMKWK